MSDVSAGPRATNEGGFRERVTTGPWWTWSVTRIATFLVTGVTLLLNRGNVAYDISYYGRWVAGALDGSRIPYRDFAWEYPPAALPAMAPPAILTWPLPTANFVPYTFAWLAMVLLLDAFVMRVLLKRSPGGLKHPAIQMWVLGLPLLGVLSWSRFDIFPATAALAAVLYAGSRRDVRSGLAAGLGATLKLWPITLAPIQRTRRAAILATAAALGFMAAVSGVTYLLTGSTGFSQVLGYQSDRGLQIESIAALPAVWLDHFGVEGYDTTFTFGAWEITGPAVPTIAQVASVTFIVGLTLIGLVHWRLMKVDAGRRGVALTAVTLLLVSLVTNKVFSPQYVLWLLAVVVAAAVLDPATWQGYVKPVLVLATLTQLVFPLFYGDILFGAWLGVFILTARDLLLLWLLVSVVRRLVREVRTAKSREREVAVSGSRTSAPGSSAARG